MNDDAFTRLYGADAFDRAENYDTAGNFKPRAIRDADAEASTQRGGFRRGYAFAQDMARVAPENIRDAAQNAYEERRARLQNQWRKDRREDADQTPPPRSFGAQAQALADGAYRDKCERLQNAWRHS
jgi:hypothetical protein